MVSLLLSKGAGEGVADQGAGGEEQPGGAARLTRYAVMDPHPPLRGTEESHPSARMAAGQSVHRANVRRHLESWSLSILISLLPFTVINNIYFMSSITNKYSINSFS